MSAHRLRRVAGAAILASLAAACSDRGPTAGSPPIPPANDTSASFIGTVDTRTGQVTFASMPQQDIGRSSSAVARNVYGTQNVDVRLTTGTTTFGTPAPGFRSYSFPLTVTNLLPFPIGVATTVDPAPDTLGIFVFFSQLPVITAPASCPGCTITVNGFQGIQKLDGTNNAMYFYYPERLGAAGSATATSVTPRTWTFVASDAVLAFRFVVKLNAAWPAPHDTSWKVDYEADTIPEMGTEPVWKLNNSIGNVGDWSVTNGELKVHTWGGQRIRFDRFDPVLSAKSAYIQARVKITATTGDTLRVAGVRILDGTRYCALGIGAGEVSLELGDASNIPGTSTRAFDTSIYHLYRLSKFRQDSVVYYIDGARIAAIPYTGCTGDSRQKMEFGSWDVPPLLPSSGSTSLWDSVIYEIGVPAPAS